MALRNVIIDNNISSSGRDEHLLRILKANWVNSIGMKWFPVIIQMIKQFYKKTLFLCEYSKITRLGYFPTIYSVFDVLY